MTAILDFAEKNKEEIAAEAKQAEELHKKALALGAVHKLVVEDDNGLIVGYLKKVDRATYSACIKILQDDAIKANETLLRTCLIKEVSDMRLVDDDETFFSVIPQLANILSLKKSTLMKL